MVNKISFKFLKFEKSLVLIVSLFIASTMTVAPAQAGVLHYVVGGVAAHSINRQMDKKDRESDKIEKKNYPKYSSDNMPKLPEQAKKQWMTQEQKDAFFNKKNTH